MVEISSGRNLFRFYDTTYSALFISFVTLVVSIGWAGRIGSCAGKITDVIDQWRTEAQVVHWFEGEQVMDGIG